MIIYSDHITERLQYIANIFSQYWYNSDAVITSNPIEFAASTLPKINYSFFDINDSCITIYPHGLLFETDIKPIKIVCSTQQGCTIFFQNESEIGFDALSAAFYLLSRYEEYLPTCNDKYGRYDFENSTAFNNRFLQIPLVDIWLRKIATTLTLLFPQHPLKKHTFIFQPTYDIDMARSYQYKGWQRNIGGGFIDLMNGNFSKFKERVQVLIRNKKDPFDSFNWLDNLHQQYQLNPIYFFLVAAENSILDKNILSETTVMQSLIQDHARKYLIGIHPSWYSNTSALVLNAEIETLRIISKQKIMRSRQHYLKMELTATYQNLLSFGITEDYTMGYGGAHGFRASTATPFFWFDIFENKTTPLKIFPFCFMEASSIYYLKQTPIQALDQLTSLYQTVQSVEGYFSMIWHNHTVGTSKEFLPWRNMYEQFIKSVQ